MNLRLDWCSYDAAKYAVEHWHYSRCMPSGKLVKIGVWENGKFIGAIMYGLGATPNLCKQFGMKMTEVAELCRVALTEHTAPVSKIIAISLKFLRKLCPGLKMVVSFADTDQGHHGGIYQAGNWFFTGSVKLDCWLVRGKKVHPRSMVAKLGTQALDKVLKAFPDAKKVWGFKHRYIFPLTDRKYWEKYHKAYPKRAGSIANDVPVHHTGEGGATPTPALQTF